MNDVTMTWGRPRAFRASRGSPCAGRDGPGRSPLRRGSEVEDLPRLSIHGLSPAVRGPSLEHQPPPDPRREAPPGDRPRHGRRVARLRRRSARRRRCGRRAGGARVPAGRDPDRDPLRAGDRAGDGADRLSLAGGRAHRRRRASGDGDHPPGDGERLRGELCVAWPAGGPDRSRCSTSTTSRPSTTPKATPQATRCCARPSRRSPPACARATSPPASAAMSSRCSWPDSRAST